MNELEILNKQLSIAQAECTRLLLENRELRNVGPLGLERAIDDVAAFHRYFGVPIYLSPMVPDGYRIILRRRLISEEYEELMAAMACNDLPQIADGIADLIYVAIGTALEFGIPLAEVWAEVQRTNMLKIGGAAREDGKIMKPEGWKPPDVAGILKRAWAGVAL